MKYPYIPLLMSAIALASCQSVSVNDDSVSNNDIEHEDHHAHESELDISLFYDGAIDIHSIEDCTLSDGTETQCHHITIVGYPVNHEVGPFCPDTLETTAEDAGIWLDGNAVYNADGEFIESLAELYNDDNWKLYDEDGNVFVTDTQEAFDAAARPDVDVAYQNYCVEGRMEWLENSEPVQTTVVIPIEPIAANEVSSGGNWGITLNGVIIAASAPVDAILGAYTIATFDDCGGHINPYDGYHLHAAMGCSEMGSAEAGDTPIIGYALDGYPIHSALADDSPLLSSLDECNGYSTHESGYRYYANPAAENSVLTCFKGLTVASETRNGPEGQDRPEGQLEGLGKPEGQAGGGRPDFTAAASQLGITEHALQDALGMPPNFSQAAQTLGISESDLLNTLGDMPPPRR